MGSYKIVQVACRGKQFRGGVSRVPAYHSISRVQVARRTGGAPGRSAVSVWRGVSHLRRGVPCVRRGAPPPLRTQFTVYGSSNGIRNKVPRRKPLPLNSDAQSTASRDKVFGEPKLLELILAYAIHSKSKKLRKKTLRAVRLVNKIWKNAVTSLKEKKKEPLYKLILTQDQSQSNSQNYESGSQFEQRRQTKLDRFVVTLANRFGENFPPFSLNIKKEFFRPQNLDSFETCLRQFGEGLMELKVQLPEDGASLPGLLPHVQLPNLQKMEITLSNPQLNTKLTVGFLQLVFNRTCNLKLIKVPTSLEPAFLLPTGFENLALPESITQLKLGCRLQNSDLEILVKNKLPHLELLELVLWNDAYAKGIFSAIMKNFCKSLKILRVQRVANCYAGPPRNVNLVRFPKMEKLKEITICNNTFELSKKQSCLRKTLPNLRQLGLYGTPNMLRKWTSNCSCPVKSVRELVVRLIDETKPGSTPGYTLPVSFQDMRGIHLAFPNVVVLRMELTAGDMNGLSYLFREMKQLRSLELELFGHENTENSDLWDSLFTGKPATIIKLLREYPGFRGNMDPKYQNPSIRMLTDLEYLSLSTAISASGGPSMEPLISDLTFQYSLLRMDNLKRLDFQGRFKASQSMAAKWERSDRTIFNGPG